MPRWRLRVREEDMSEYTDVNDGIEELSDENSMDEAVSAEAEAGVETA